MTVEAVIFEDNFFGGLFYIFKSLFAYKIFRNSGIFRTFDGFYVLFSQYYTSSGILTRIDEGFTPLAVPKQYFDDHLDGLEMDRVRSGN